MELIGIALILFVLLLTANWLSEEEKTIVIKYDGVRLSDEDKEKIKIIISETVNETSKRKQRI